jgi:hypothetical protein
MPGDRRRGESGRLATHDVGRRPPDANGRGPGWLRVQSRLASSPADDRDLGEPWGGCEDWRNWASLDTCNRTCIVMPPGNARARERVYFGLDSPLRHRNKWSIGGWTID